VPVEDKMPLLQWRTHSENIGINGRLKFARTRRTT
jgi:hypothetical protein